MFSQSRVWVRKGRPYSLMEDCKGYGMECTTVGSVEERICPMCHNPTFSHLCEYPIPIALPVKLQTLEGRNCHQWFTSVYHSVSTILRHG